MEIGAGVVLEKKTLSSFQCALDACVRLNLMQNKMFCDAIMAMFIDLFPAWFSTKSLFLISV